MTVALMVLIQIFQFHKGTIKTIESPESAWLIWFQFHKGTIKTPKLSILKLK